MAPTWDTINNCPKAEGVKYDLFVVQLPGEQGNFIHPPRRLADCEFIPPPVYINQRDTHPQSIPREFWEWCSPDMGMLNTERFIITHYRDVDGTPDGFNILDYTSFPVGV